MANPNPAAVTQHLTALNMSFIDSVASKVMYPCPPPTAVDSRPESDSRPEAVSRRSIRSSFVLSTNTFPKSHR